MPHVHARTEVDGFLGLGCAVATDSFVDTLFGTSETPVTGPFWEGASSQVLLILRFSRCGHQQFHLRPFCLACESTVLE